MMTAMSASPSGWRRSWNRWRLTDAAIGIIILADFIARLLGSDTGFCCSMLRQSFRSYRIASRMKRNFQFVRCNYETIVAGTHLIWGEFRQGGFINLVLC